MRLIDRAAQTNRWRHMPTAEKLAVSLCGLAVAALSPSPGVKGAVFLLMGGLVMAGARVRPADYLRALAVPAGFIATGVAAQAVTLSLSGGPVLALAGPEAMARALSFAATGFASVSALLFLALTTPLTRLVEWLEDRGLNPHLADVALVMFRMIWLTLDCLESGERALKGRLGHRSFRGILTSHGLLLAALLPRVLARARRLETGLAARGYQGRLVFLSGEAPARSARVWLTLAAFAGLFLAGHLA
ncbi:CbiQ family ECF transporter T component [Gellertiella hungarica]|uniref:Cobalt/nickel transport system permease protein n=1 Tax=Gellertiella hungarica TaxID=1572859 RepID=A0A7W6NKL0_9HYPH|nr:CbiQ family ECF transporter T component [Gellertiella hungarica]MBB4064510.1 cobalt/nickel transport system permease protein [Gellertiella hungarica]